MQPQAIHSNYTTLYVVRHGETEWNKRDILQGQLDSKLTQQGLDRAAELARRLEKVHFDAVFSSDLLRARQTAQVLLLQRELKVVTDKLLRERNWGRYDGVKADIFRQEARDLLRKYDRLSDEEKWRFKFAQEIESNQEVHARFMAFLKEVAVAYRGKTLLVVTHMGVISALLHQLGKNPRGIGNLAYVVIWSDGVNVSYVRSEGIQFLGTQ